jgi:dimethylaniline monooxygenase (N-oxide forming)
VTARAAVIGAGASGLVTARLLIQSGVDTTVYEAGSHAGGLWVYDNDNGQSIAYRNLHINTHKRRTQYRHFPFPAGTIDFARHDTMATYFEDYAKYFDIMPRIRFSDRVLGVARAGGRWTVTSSASGTESYDSVVVASGHYGTPRWPELPGQFTGDIIHSAFYRTQEGYAGKRVLLVGIGQSACDIAVDVSWVADRTVISARTGALVGPRWVLAGIPRDLLLTRLDGVHAPRFVLERLSRAALYLHSGSIEKHGFRRPPGRTQPSDNQFLASLVRYGRIGLEPGIKAVEGKEVEFENGHKEEFDKIIAATGYLVSLPFLKGVVEITPDCSDVLGLYKRVASIDNPGLYFVGLVGVHLGGPPLQLYERQAELVADLVEGSAHLPPRAEMVADVERRRETVRERYVNRPRHALLEPLLKYQVEIEKERKRLGASDRGWIDRASIPGPSSRYGRLCWQCGRELTRATARVHHGTDWGSLRWWPRAYTRPVLLCSDCYAANRRTEWLLFGILTLTALLVGGLLILAVKLVAAIAGVAS